MHPKCSVAKTHHFYGGPYIMGVVNVTPDSFSDGGQYYNHDNAIDHGLKLISEGADILDIGGESTRPGAEIVDIEDEINRVVSVIEALKGRVKWISIDTRNARTMEAALKAGANIINDISGLSYDTLSIKVAAEAKVPVILMHMQGSPETMQNNPIYNNTILEIVQYLQKRIDICEQNRIETDLLILDPGIGFGKTLEDNRIILSNISDFHDLGLPLLLGTSRKSFIAAMSNNEPVDERFAGSVASALWGLSQGVQIFRVHDVKETKQAFDVWRQISGD